MQIWKYKIAMYLETIKYNKMENTIDHIAERIKEMDSIMSRKSDKLEKINNMLNKIVEKISDISSKINTSTTYETGPR